MSTDSPVENQHETRPLEYSHNHAPPTTNAVSIPTYTNTVSIGNVNNDSYSSASAWPFGSAEPARRCSVRDIRTLIVRPSVGNNDIVGSINKRGCGTYPMLIHVVTKKMEKEGNMYQVCKVSVSGISSTGAIGISIISALEVREVRCTTF